MFLEFFYTLRANRIPVSIAEYLDLLKVLKSLTEKGESISPERFYYLSRHCLIKDLKHYDDFDLCYSQIFSKLISESSDFHQRLEEWLKQAYEQELSDQRKQDAMKLPPEELLQELEKRLKEQKERHDGGNYWIGTGGTSAFGHSGFNPQGIRIGGKGQSRSALVVAGERKFKEYRTDETLNLRQMKMALKKLRRLSRRGRPQISIKKSIEQTCREGGEIQIVEESSRKNTLKVVLLMDVGGSMDIHSQRVGQLFSALHQMNHFKEFKSYYFHNIFYDHVYTSGHMIDENAVAIDDLYKRFDSETRLIIVGDAYMAPYELFYLNGEMRKYYDTFGRVRHQYKKQVSPIAIDRVSELAAFFPHHIWLNPEGEDLWSEPTINAIREHFSMYRLTLEGLESGIKKLIMS